MSARFLLKMAAMLMVISLALAGAALAAGGHGHAAPAPATPEGQAAAPAPAPGGMMPGMPMMGGGQGHGQGQGQAGGMECPMKAMMHGGMANTGDAEMDFVLRLGNQLRQAQGLAQAQAKNLTDPDLKKLALDQAQRLQEDLDQLRAWQAKRAAAAPAAPAKKAPAQAPAR